MFSDSNYSNSTCRQGKRVVRAKRLACEALEGRQLLTNSLSLGPAASALGALSYVSDSVNGAQAGHYSFNDATEGLGVGGPSASKNVASGPEITILDYDVSQVQKELASGNTIQSATMTFDKIGQFYREQAAPGAGPIEVDISGFSGHGSFVESDFTASTTPAGQFEAGLQSGQSSGVGTIVTQVVDITSFIDQYLTNPSNSSDLDMKFTSPTVGQTVGLDGTDTVPNIYLGEPFLLPTIDLTFTNPLSTTPNLPTLPSLPVAPTPPPAQPTPPPSQPTPPPSQPTAPPMDSGTGIDAPTPEQRNKALDDSINRFVGDPSLKPSKNDTHCSEFLRDVAEAYTGTSIPELQGQANDQFNQLEQASESGSEWKKLDFHHADPRLQDMPPGTPKERREALTEARQQVQQQRQEALDQAQNEANDGNLVVVAYKNSHGHGHVAVVQPGEETTSSKWGLDVPHVAQAGTSNFSNGSLSQGFGSNKKPSIEVFVYKKP